VENSEIILRLMLSILVGGMIGYEREYRNRPAGFRTNILVCVGAALISMIQVHMIDDTVQMIGKDPRLANALKADIGRIGAQVISGIGFLGAGTIIHEKGSIKGLTTAASIWVVGCIGLCIGMGYYFLTAVATIGMYGVLVTLKKIETRIIERTNIIKLEIEYSNEKDLAKCIYEYLENRNIKIKNIGFYIDEDYESLLKTAIYTILIPKNLNSSRIIHDLSVYEGIDRVTIV
jgi:putative Mg2+ transporter-C (MgtC) family protein